VLASNSARLVDQAESLRETFEDGTFDFVVGYDTLVRLFDPGYYKSMFAELEPFFAVHRVIASNRGKAGVSDVERFVEQHAGSFAERIIICEIPERTAGYSSMDARAAISNGAESAMLPPEVQVYVREQGLYRD
jgi:nicotinic acid mononucleotide adenylyltransferase